MSNPRHAKRLSAYSRTIRRIQLEAESFGAVVVSVNWSHWDSTESMDYYEMVVVRNMALLVPGKVQTQDFFHSAHFSFHDLAFDATGTLNRALEECLSRIQKNWSGE